MVAWSSLARSLGALFAFGPRPSASRARQASASVRRPGARVQNARRGAASASASATAFSDLQARRLSMRKPS